MSPSCVEKLGESLAYVITDELKQKQEKLKYQNELLIHELFSTAPEADISVNDVIAMQQSTNKEAAYASITTTTCISAIT